MPKSSATRKANMAPGWPTALVAGFVVAAALCSGCTLFTPDSCMQAFPTPSLTAVVRVPTPDAPGPSTTGSCGEWVEYQDVWYTQVRVPGPAQGWAIADTELTHVGHATRRAVTLRGLRGADVFAIGDVDPAVAIAMRGTAAGDILVFRGREGDDPLPPELCAYLEEEARGVPGGGCLSPSPGAVQP